MSTEFSTNKAPGAFPTKVGAFAFGGGGFKSVGCFWPVMYQISKTQDMKKLLHGCHLGATSGGGWFFTNLIFNRQVWESITTGKSEEQFKAMHRKFFEDILRELRKNELPLGPIKEKIIADCLADDHLKGMLGGGGFPLFDRDMVEWLHHFLSMDNGWKALNATVSHVLSDTPNGDLEVTCDMANSILTKATIDQQNGWFVDHVRYTEIKKDGQRHPNSQVPMSLKIRVNPKETTHTISLHQDEQFIVVKDASNDFHEEFLGNLVCKCAADASSTRVSKADIERGTRAMMTKPLDLAGPTSCYLGCFNFNFFASYNGMSENHFARNILMEVEHKLLYKSFYHIDATDDQGTALCPLRLVDGGPWDHTGITMAVKGMQREGRDGDIVGISLNSIQDYAQFHALFKDNGDPSHSCEPPYPAIFKGSSPKEVAAYGEHLQVLDCEVETLDRPEWEVKGGHKYRLFQILLATPGLKLFPFKEESIEEYSAWCAQSVSDLNDWAAGKMRAPA